uniref:Coiled-coil domain-containing protein 66 n=1 Tax=Phallusia mammillata TaxID=59560 RepID=A0A6F9D9F1_9ASCI|nr:coiled-coil domain-containing protein 66 [Phallusia mammillata]
MDVGDGLTLAKTVIGGKKSSVILFSTHGNSKTKSKARKDGVTYELKQRKKVTTLGPKNSKSLAPQSQQQKNKDNWEIKSPSTVPISKTQKNQPLKANKKEDQTLLTVLNPKSRKIQQQNNTENTDIQTSSTTSATKKQKSTNQRNKELKPSDIDKNAREQDKTDVKSSTEDGTKKTLSTNEVVPNYVALTHDQLNSILNLVQANITKEHSVESTNFLSLATKDLLQGTESTVSPTVEKAEEKVGSETTELSSDTESKKIENDEENSTVENTPSGEETKSVSVTDEKQEVNPGTILGFGMRDQQKSKLETSRQKWLEELNEQVRTNKEKSMNKPDHSREKRKTENTATTTEPLHLRNQSLPAAMRSSFFLGEFTPRDHAYSAKKKTEQQRWKQELDQQLDAKNKKETNVRRISPSSSTDQSDWTKHFDTFTPNRKPTEFDLTQHTGTNAESAQELTLPLVEKQESLLSTKEESPERLTHLRTMTSLLDPAEIEAMELRRLKQEEHRRAINQQVDEKRKLKEDEKKAQRQVEEMEEKRLAEDRIKLQVQYEKEKHQQLVKEEKREQQTRKLYQQIQEAEAFALRDKLERRKHILHDNGHDTSRLEKTHNTLLATKSLPATQQLPDKTKPILFASTEKSESYNEREQPVSVTTNTSNGKIKLEISLSQSSGNFEFAEAAVQTENDDFNSTYASRANNTKFSSRTSPGLGLERKHAKKTLEEPIDADPPSGQIENNKKPKWGVGHQKKQYIPASQRYSNGEKWKKLHHQRMKAREAELLNQQALNQPNKRITDKKKMLGTKNDQEPTFLPVETNTEKSQRVASALSVTTDQAKYEASRHSSSSPVPDTLSFVEYRRSDSVLDPNEEKPAPDTNTTSLQDSTKGFMSPENKDPLLDGNLKQRERHDRILHEISILRQGLLLKQREVASYPVNMGKITTSNLPERQNEFPAT